MDQQRIDNIRLLYPGWDTVIEVLDALQAAQAENARLREALRGAEHLGIVARDFPCQSKDEPPRGWYMCYCGTKFVYVDGVLQGKHGDRCSFKALEVEG